MTNDKDTRTVLKQEVARFLQTDDRIEVVVPCQSGLYPGLALITFLDLWMRERIISSTPTSLFLFDRERFKPTVKSLLFQGDKGTMKVLNLRGIYGRVEVAGEKLWVHRRFFSDVQLVAGLPSDKAPT